MSLLILLQNFGPLPKLKLIASDMKILINKEKKNIEIFKKTNNIKDIKLSCHNLKGFFDNKDMFNLYYNLNWNNINGNYDNIDKFLLLVDIEYEKIEKYL